MPSESCVRFGGVSSNTSLHEGHPRHQHTDLGLCRTLRNSGQIFDLWFDGVFDFVISDFIPDELQRISIRKLKFKATAVQDVLLQLRGLAYLVEPARLDIRGIPENDLPIVGTAVAGDVDYLITGDKILLVHKTVVGIPIISPRDFLKEIL